MSEYFFGLGKGHLSKKVEKIAEKHGATLVNHTEPGGFKRHWFAIPNRGSPFDQAKASEVLAAIQDISCES